MAQRKALGKQYGPTGRKRDTFDVFAKNRAGKELDKPYHGRTGREAYGQEGVREAKRGYHKAFPHTWKKFGVYNQSRLHRQAEKKRTVKGVKYVSEIDHRSQNGKHIYISKIYKMKGKQKGLYSTTPFGTRKQAERDAELKIARYTQYLKEES